MMCRGFSAGANFSIKSKLTPTLMNLEESVLIETSLNLAKLVQKSDKTSADLMTHNEMGKACIFMGLGLAFWEEWVCYSQVGVLPRS